MKKITLVIVALLAVMSLSAQTKSINIAKSTIKWTEKKVTGEHAGSVSFKDGALVTKNKKITGGTFTADMTTLSNTDQKGSEKEKLEGHLKSADFFDTDANKTAKLVFKTIAEKKPNVYSVTADLTIKGKTNPVKFDLTVKGKTADTSFSVDRTKFGIQYGSGSFFDDLGDRTIYDEFDLDIHLEW